MNLSGLNLNGPLGLLLLALLAAGCAAKPSLTYAVRPAHTQPAAPIITPDYSLAARVISVNLTGRFVVLSFPANRLPKLEQTLFLYRGGLKVAEIRVTGPQADNNTVADLITGEAQVGDTVRDQ